MSTATATPPSTPAAPASGGPQIVAPGTPVSESSPVTPSTKSMISDVFAGKPPGTTPAPAAAPAKPAEAAAPAAEPAKPQTLHDRAAPKPEPAKTAEAEWPHEKAELPANASPEAKQNFANLKASMKKDWLAEKNARAQAEQQLATYRTAQPADQTKLTELQTQLQAAHDRLMILDTQNHPDFVKQYVAPKTQALTAATEVLAYNNIELDAAGLLAKPLKDFSAAVAEATKNMNSMDANTVQSELRNAYRLAGEERKALANAGDLHKAIQSKAAQAARDAFEAVTKEMSGSDFLARFETPEGASPEEKAANDAYNSGVDGIRASAEKYAFGKLDEKAVGSLAYKGAMLDFMQSHVVPRLSAEYAKLKASHGELLEQLKAVKGDRAPNPAGERAAGDGAAPTVKEMVDKAFRGGR
jgi:hypothetical protein